MKALLSLHTDTFPEMRILVNTTTISQYLTKEEQRVSFCLDNPDKTDISLEKLKSVFIGDRSKIDYYVGLVEVEDEKRIFIVFNKGYIFLSEFNEPFPYFPIL